jgi:hypothetical protein
MYPNTLERLYKALQFGKPEDVKKIIESKEIEDAVLSFHGTDMIKAAMKYYNLEINNTDEKIKILLDAGLLPKINQDNNFLLDVVAKIKDTAIRDDVLTKVVKSFPKFAEYYPQAHSQAIDGIQPTNQQALETDAYGLLRIYTILVIRLMLDYIKPIYCLVAARS